MVVATAVMAVAVAGCGAVPTAPPVIVSPSASAPASASLGTSAASLAPGAGVADPALVAALSYLSDDAPQVAFTNWATVLAGQAPGSASDLVKLLTSLNRTRAIPAGLLLPRIALLRETWGFDVFDLAWEADFSGKALYSVLQFGHTFDLAPIVALLDKRGYDRGDDVGGAAVYSHKLEMAQPWVASAPLHMLNVAVLAADHRLVIASSPDGLALALAAGSAATPAPDSLATRGRAVAAALASPYGALLTAEEGACHGFSGGPAQPAASARADLSGVGTTLATAIGFSAAAGAPAVTLALLYPDAAAAAKDVAPRTALTGAASVRNGLPFAEVAMALANGRAAGPVVLFDGTPRDGRPQLAITAWLSRDLQIAACP